MGEGAEGRPAALVRGLSFDDRPPAERDGRARDLVRPRERDPLPVILALAGGVGGAKLAHGLQTALAASGEGDLLTRRRPTPATTSSIWGFASAPTIDTVAYTLSGRANPETGWGVAGETWSFMDALATVGGEGWFRLGDRDLATHVERTRASGPGRA